MPDDDATKHETALQARSVRWAAGIGQDIKAGDRFHLAPAASAALEMGLVDPGRALVLRVPPGSPPGPFDFSWAFVLQPQSDGTTRLLVRERYAYRQWWTRCLVEAVEVASFIMSRRMPVLEPLGEGRHVWSGRARSSQSLSNAARRSGRSCMSAWPAPSTTARVACG